MASAVMKEVSKRIDSMKSKILYENKLQVPDKKIMHAWFKYFDQNLKGLQGAETKLDLYSAFKTMADKGVLLPPFNNLPQPLKGTSQLSDFTRGFNAMHFEQRLNDYIKESNDIERQKERPKSVPAIRETKTIVKNKKVIEEASDRTTTVSTTLEVVSNEPDTDVLAARPPLVQQKHLKSDAATTQQLKRERTNTIKALQEEIVRAAKVLSPEKQDNVGAWLKILNDKLKRENELEARIKALTALKISLSARKLLSPFDQVPTRGKLNVQQFMSLIDLTDMETQAMSALPKKKKSKPVVQTDHPMPIHSKTPQKGIHVADLTNPELKNDVIQAVVQNMGKALNAICNEDIKALENIPTLSDQVETAFVRSPYRTVDKQFTPITLKEFPNESQVVTRARLGLYDPLKNLIYDEIENEITKEGLSDLDQSIYDYGAEDEELYDEYLIPESFTHNREFTYTRSAEKGSEQKFKMANIQYDPETFAVDNPEFNFIPAEIKSYIKRMVKKELIHWPAFLQDLVRGFSWPQYTEPGELIQFSPFK